MNKKELRYFNVAKAISATSEFKRIKIGACIVNHKDIVAVSANLTKGHPRQEMLNCKYRGFATAYGSLHAELNAIIKAQDTEDASIFVYREDNNGNLANCMPCKACMKAIVDSGIKEIYYTDTDGFKHIFIGED